MRVSAGTSWRSVSRSSPRCRRTFAAPRRGARFRCSSSAHARRTSRARLRHHLSRTIPRQTKTERELFAGLAPCPRRRQSDPRGRLSPRHHLRHQRREHAPGDRRSQGRPRATHRRGDRALGDRTRLEGRGLRPRKDYRVDRDRHGHSCRCRVECWCCPLDPGPTTGATRGNARARGRNTKRRDRP